MAVASFLVIEGCEQQPKQASRKDYGSSEVRQALSNINSLQANRDKRMFAEIEAGTWSQPVLPPCPQK